MLGLVETYSLQPFWRRSELTNNIPVCDWSPLHPLPKATAELFSLYISKVIPGLPNVPWGSRFWSSKAACPQGTPAFLPRHLRFFPDTWPSALCHLWFCYQVKLSHKQVSSSRKNSITKSQKITKASLVHSTMSFIVGNFVHFFCAIYFPDLGTIFGSCTKPTS